MDELTILRNKITRVDQEILALFEKRMALVAEISQYKKTHHLAILDKEREKALLDFLTTKLENRHLIVYYQELFHTFMKISQDYQKELHQN